MFMLTFDKIKQGTNAATYVQPGDVVYFNDKTLKWDPKKENGEVFKTVGDLLAAVIRYGKLKGEPPMNDRDGYHIVEEAK